MRVPLPPPLFITKRKTVYDVKLADFNDKLNKELSDGWEIVSRISHSNEGWIVAVEKVEKV